LKSNGKILDVSDLLESKAIEVGVAAAVAALVCYTTDAVFNHYKTNLSMSMSMSKSLLS